MKGQRHRTRPGFRLLPATSANLGPGFDAVGLALSLSLVVEAEQAHEDTIHARGRNPERCGSLEDNLILDTYRSVLEAKGQRGDPLLLTVVNEIPLGMGCGSSAAARLAGVALANHFGELGMDDRDIVAEASEREGHPDNVSACGYGGVTIAVPEGGQVHAASFPCDATWQLLLALPSRGVATETARALLPDQLSREDAVFNVQRAALLTAAFAQGRLDLLQVAMQDRMHQPHRRSVCSFLESLDVLATAKEFAGVALSGAGPALLAILSETATLAAAEHRMRSVLGEDVELLPVRIGERTRWEIYPE